MLEETKRKQARQIDLTVNQIKIFEEKNEQLTKQLGELKADIEKKTKEAALKLRAQDEQEKEIASYQREIDMRNIEIKLHAQKMRQMKDENTKIRMQLKDPANIKRDVGSNLEPSQNAGLVDEFDRVQQQYDLLTIQEELKQMIIENKLLKEKVYDMQDRFKIIEGKRETFIGELEQQIKDFELEETKNVERRKISDKKAQQLQDMEGQNQTLKSQIDFLTRQNRQKDVD